MKNYLLVFVASLIISSLACKNLLSKESLNSKYID